MSIRHKNPQQDSSKTIAVSHKIIIPHDQLSLHPKDSKLAQHLQTNKCDKSHKEKQRQKSHDHLSPCKKIK